VIVSTGEVAGRDPLALVAKERSRRKLVADATTTGDGIARTLALAADAFVVRRGEDLRTIVAGYPWFSDWGRDADDRPPRRVPRHRAPRRREEDSACVRAIR